MTPGQIDSLLRTLQAMAARNGAAYHGDVRAIRNALGRVTFRYCGRLASMSYLRLKLADKR